MKVASRALVLCCFGCLVHAALAAAAPPGTGMRGTDPALVDSATAATPPTASLAPPAAKPAVTAATGAGLLGLSALLVWMVVRRQRSAAAGTWRDGATDPPLTAMASAAQGFTLEAFPDLTPSGGSTPFESSTTATSTDTARADPRILRKRNKHRQRRPASGSKSHQAHAERDTHEAHALG